MLTPASHAERRSQQTRLIAMRVGVVICFSLLAVTFWVMQVVEHTRYAEIAENQTLKTIPLRAPRGLLYDRNGKMLVENQYSFTISIVRELSPRADHNVDDTVRRLAQATGIDEARALDEVKRHKHEALFRPIPIVEHASMAQVSAVMARQVDMPEVVVNQEPTRRYVYGDLASHLLGYVGEIQDAQLDRPEYEGVASGAMVGQTGLERTYNTYLMGRDGKREVAVSSTGREVAEVGTEDPVTGSRVQLTIDYDIQRALDEAYSSRTFAGAAVVLDPRNGEVLALLSQPEFDLNSFATGLGRSTWSALSTDPLKPLQDRPLQGRYAPGSTFKIVMAIAALSEGIITPDFRVYCPGSITIYNHPYHCDKHEGHGSLDLREALEQSCDVYFFKLASMMSIDTIHDYAAKLGLVGKTGIDLPNELDSVVPSTEARRRVGQKWYAGETISVGIGQGPIDVTPISLATMISAVANGGTVVTPHVVQAIDQGQGWVKQHLPEPRSIIPIAPEVIEPVRDGLWDAVNRNGTGVLARVAGHDVVGKTGTAQVASLDTIKAARASGSTVNLHDNSWFVFYAPRENPEIAGVVFAEHAGWGASSAAPIARFALETYFAKKEGRPLPTVEVSESGDFTIKPGTVKPADPAGRAGTPAPKKPN